MLGVDVSNNNGHVDWHAIKRAGYEFAFAKVSEGATFTDRYYPGNLAEAKRAGVAFGGYHFAKPAQHTPEKEAAHFLKLVRAAECELRPVLDYEDPASTRLGPSKLTGWARVWLEIVEHETGLTPIFYSYPDYITAAMGGAYGLARFPLWLASYGPNDGKRHKPALVGYWPRIALHQYTSNGQVPGIAGRADLNYAYTLDPLRRTPKPAPTPGFVYDVVADGTSVNTGQRLDDPKFRARLLELVAANDEVTVKRRRGRST